MIPILMDPYGIDMSDNIKNIKALNIKHKDKIEHNYNNKLMYLV